MVDPKTAFNGVRNALQQSHHLSNVRDADILLREPDLEGEDSHLQSPFIAIHPLDVIRSSPHDTDFVGFVEDSAGNHIGKRFKATFDVPLQLDIYVAAGDSDNDATTLGHSLFQALRPYDRHNENKPLPNEADEPIEDIEDFRLGNGGREDDLTQSPSIRRWSGEAMLSFSDTVNNTDDYDQIEVVHPPRDDDGESTDGGPMIEYTY